MRYIQSLLHKENQKIERLPHHLLQIKMFSIIATVSSNLSRLIKSQNESIFNSHKLGTGNHTLFDLTITQI